MILIISDLHLTGRMQDEYRWALFPWLQKIIQRKRADRVFILGDITHEKDDHSSHLVNRITKNFTALAALVEEVRILKGNHDYTDPDTPYFGFLNSFSKIIYHTESEVIRTSGASMHMIPHIPNGEKAYPKEKTDYAFFHQAIRGCNLQNGFALEAGVSSDAFKGYKRAIGGDIHVPQDINSKVTYCGAPYPIDFGDTYEPRVLLFYPKTNELKSLPVPTIAKRTAVITDITDLKDFNYNAGDHLRVIVRLKRKQMYEWSTICEAVREWCNKNDVELRSLKMEEVQREVLEKQQAVIESNTPVELLEKYAEQNNIAKQFVTDGLRILEEL